MFVLTLLYPQNNKTEKCTGKYTTHNIQYLYIQFVTARGICTMGDHSCCRRLRPDSSQPDPLPLRNHTLREVYEPAAAWMQTEAANACKSYPHKSNQFAPSIHSSPNTCGATSRRFGGRCGLSSW